MGPGLPATWAGAQYKHCSQISVHLIICCFYFLHYLPSFMSEIEALQHEILWVEKAVYCH